LIDANAKEDVRRRTKIVATLGPATDDPAVLEDLILAGADVFRINFSHGTAADQAKRVETVRRVEQKVGRHIGIMGDLQGPKIRIESFKNGPVMLVEEPSSCSTRRWTRTAAISTRSASLTAISSGMWFRETWCFSTTA
jgi:pyruvate kinase